MSTLQEQNKAVASAFVQAMGSTDWDAVRNLMADDATWWIPGDGIGGGTWSREDFIDFNKAALARMAAGPFSLKAVRLTAEEDRVCVEAESHLELKNGKTYRNDYCFCFIIKDGKLKSAREHMNSKHATEVFE